MTAELVPHLWRDADGNVRVGRGHKVATEEEALALDWFGSPPEQEIREAWRAVAHAIVVGRPGREPWKAYAHLSRLTLTAKGERLAAVFTAERARRAKLRESASP